MAALQGVSYADNTSGVNTISPIIRNASLTGGLTLSANGALYYCSHMPNMNAAQCTIVAANNTTSGGETGFVLAWKRDLQTPKTKPDYSRIEARRPRSSAKWKRTVSPDGTTYRNYKPRQFRRRSKPGQAVLPAPAQSKPPTAPVGTAPVQQNTQTCAKALLWLEAAYVAFHRSRSHKLKKYTFSGLMTSEEKISSC